ncbi:HypC/HybG/HupF family hydrogenase formation chaperone [Ureibacillus terrenus]|uniref:HypC/HybG/HupF family hydrogenase formation chaperone n=1 Tax=Ureibacillus terrenus TaxID=118246 RepID=A0A540UWZ6_9BACL|nr:HypC/HybG/HupF family hydrogenase formation chaperone [Ureibacillus terrenus]MED3763463.1 HypC/HybG/HupF family hydrogenase formation chaperone [Ureibacillus terrenus]TQE88991.1 HypC/HybG/HupF family hydrogenase formation chaperone [Ureibacillus terrenus]
MCLAIPGKIVELLDDRNQYAMIDVSGVRRKVNISLIQHEGVKVNDWVLIHVGFAMNKISEKQALEQLQLLQEIGEDKEAMTEIKGYQFD